MIEQSKRRGRPVTGQALIPAESHRQPDPGAYRMQLPYIGRLAKRPDCRVQRQNESGGQEPDAPQFVPDRYRADQGRTVTGHLAARGYERPLIALAGGQPESQPWLLPAGRFVRRCRENGQCQPDRHLSSGDLGRRYREAALCQGRGFAGLSELNRDPGRGGGAVLVEAGG